MSFSEFTKEDYKLIKQEYDVFIGHAAGRCRSEEELALVKKAFDFANTAHRNVRRRSGEPYIIHPIAVANIVITEIGLGCKSICAALLHDVVEDTEYTVQNISDLFGEKVASLVDGLTKIKTVLDNEDRRGNAYVYPESLQAENFKRILLTLNDDVRVVLIKLADRLHNCRTIEFMPEHKRDKILSETMYIFIPLAHRLGLYSVKSEMENIWLRFKEPDEFNEITRRISQNVALRDREIDEFIAPIAEELTQAGIKFTVKKRIKTPYSIWYKMQTKHVPFDQIYDLYAVRIIYDPKDQDPVSERNEAYIIYATVTKLYRDQPSRLRDWIKQSKSNGYEALHCTLMSKAGIWIEVQIRSRRMDDIAEKGIAAHWTYKNNGYTSENDSEVDKWLASIQDVLDSNDVNAVELLDIIHGDLTSKDIVVFTPKGEQRTVKNGTTVLDFAYMIHTDIGSSAIAAKVNMKLVPLSQVLKPGDQVEIITARTGHPKAEWLQFLTSRHARALVIEYFRNERDAMVAQGRQIYEERLEAMNMKSDRATLQRFLNYARLREVDELYFRIGLGIIGPEDFTKIVNGADNESDDRYIITPGGVGSRRYVMADCCHPIPGDPVIGFLSGKDTVIIHKKSCTVAENIASKFGEKVVVPEWVGTDMEFPIRISVRGIDRVGLLNDITSEISRNQGINIRKIQLGAEEDIMEGYIELLVKDKNNLKSMLEGLQKIEGLQDVLRTDIA
ncbi:MAG: bifunctional (p)ppGpp synthetase/guanosine-3',5'-bis(diphosphate) 3'-pyrophosphohydrolase [Bacteroidales bacterium]|nr:bifunctional (p)ppGpp synthetase/guanosine-3',5'-bis(diphosphate) 3'-pyrophosphohydrolase [Bacteroidales bacterium]